MIGTLIGTLMFGRGFKERISRLEQHSEQKPIQQNVSISITKDGELVNVAQDTTKPVFGPIIEVFPDEQIARFGTKQGTLEIRYGDDAMMIHDIAMILHKNGIIGVLEPRKQTSSSEREKK